MNSAKGENDRGGGELSPDALEVWAVLAQAATEARER